MANDSAKKMLATNTALMRKYTRVILGCNVSTLARRDTYLDYFTHSFFSGAAPVRLM